MTLYHVDCYTVACLLVGLVIALNGKHRVDAVICPTLQSQTFARCQTADAPLAQNAGGFPAMHSDTVADSGVYAPRHFCNFRVWVQVDKIQRSLSAAGGEGVGNLLAHPSAPTVDCGVTQVDAVTDLCQLVAGLGGALDWYAHLIQPGFTAEPARIGSRRTA